MEHVVIVGGGLAGHRALQALREFEGKVTLVSDEDHKPYDRPPLSKQVLLGDMEADATYFKVDDLDVEWVLGDAAASLDAENKTLKLASGREIPYDGLVVATGRRAREFPDLPDLEGFHMLRSLDDSLQFKEAASGVDKIVIVGAGFIGCEVAASMKKQGVEEVTLIDIADQPMPVIGEAAGAIARKFHEDAGVVFKLGSGVAGFKGSDGKVTGVELDDGSVIDADLVLLSLGSLPNSEWLEDSGAQLDRGNVCTDEYLFVEGLEDVVAAGDIASWAHPHSDNDDGRVCIEHWTTSREMAKAAVVNLIADKDERTPFVSVPTFWSDQYDVKIKSAGYIKCADRFETVEEDPEKQRLVIEAFRGDELVGAIVFNKNKAFITYSKQLKEALAAS